MCSVLRNARSARHSDAAARRSKDGASIFFRRILLKRTSFDYDGELPWPPPPDGDMSPYFRFFPPPGEAPSPAASPVFGTIRSNAIHSSSRRLNVR
jgi:hypothetical protein